MHLAGGAVKGGRHTQWLAVRSHDLAAQQVIRHQGFVGVNLQALQQLLGAGGGSALALALCLAVWLRPGRPRPGPDGISPLGDEVQTVQAPMACAGCRVGCGVVLPALL